MEKQKLTGYRNLSQAETDLINEIKAKGVELGALVEKLFDHARQQLEQANAHGAATGDFTGSSDSSGVVLQKSNFSLKLVTPISFSQIELTFNHNISQKTDDNREFKVMNKSDSLDELGVIKTQVDQADSTKLLLTFDKS